MIKVDKLNSGFEFDASAGKFKNSTEGIGCPGQSSTTEIVFCSNLITWSSSLEPKSLVLYLVVGLKLYPMENPLIRWPHFFDSWLIFDGKLDDNGSPWKNPDIKTPLEKWIATLSEKLTHEYK